MNPDRLHVTLGLRGPEDHVALFRFILGLARDEGSTPSFEVESSENQMIGRSDLSDSAETWAARTLESGADKFTVDLREPDNSASATLEAVSLMSPSADWLRKQEQRWLDAGGSRDGVRCFSRIAIVSKRFAKPAGLAPMVEWLYAVAGRGQLDVLYYDAKDVPHKTQFAAGVIEATCTRLAAVADITKLGTVTMVGPLGEASVTPTDNSSAYAKVGTLDALATALTRWRAVDIDA